MGNQVTNQNSSEQQGKTASSKKLRLPAKTSPSPLADEQQQKKNSNSKNSAPKEPHQKRPSHWLPGRKKRPDTEKAQSNSKHQGTNGTSNQNGTDGSIKCNGRGPLGLSTAAATDKVSPTVISVDEAIVIADMTPSPDSANRTWTSEAGRPPPFQELELQMADPAEVPDAVPSRNHQRDSGVSQLSTEEFDRVFEEMCQTSSSQDKLLPQWNQPSSKPEAETDRQLEELLAPRLRAKLCTPSIRRRIERTQSVSSFVARTEELLLLRQELISSTPQRRSACSAINDDHMFPDAVTPTKVDSGLLADYDVPYMDDENFFVYDDWYVTDDKRWSYLRRSDIPQLADCWDDCRLTASVANSAKPTPHSTPTKLFGGRRALFGLCFGAKSQA